MRLKITTDYAFRIIRAIYLEDSNTVTTKMLCEKENISQGVIMKILRELKQHDIVASHQGRGNSVGGFSLKAKLEDITIYDIIVIMEGPAMLTFPRSVNYKARYGECSINKELERVSCNFINDLKKNSLYEVLIGEREKEVKIVVDL